MFSIIYGITKLIGTSIYKYNENSITKNERKKSLDNGDDIYFDSNGAMWYCENGYNERCVELYNYNIWTFRTDCVNGHHVLVSAKDMRIVLKDYTEEENVKHEMKFYKQYNDAMKAAKIEGKSWFEVIGINSIDKRYGFYEVKSGRKYEIFKYGQINTHYFKRYCECLKNKDFTKNEWIEISKQEYDNLGGDYVGLHYEISYNKYKGYRRS